MDKNFKKLVYNCMADYEKAFFPNSFAQTNMQLNKSAEELGIALAKESVKKIKITVSNFSSSD